MARVLMVIASRNFRDEEYFGPREVFVTNGLEVITAASREGPVRGSLGGWAISERILARARAIEFDAIVFVGGEGAKEYFTSASAKRLAREALEKGKVVGAICIAPLILAQAGLLAGRRVTAWPPVRGDLEKYGAIVDDAPVVVDGTLVTADGPASARLFAEAVIKALSRRHSET